MPSASVPWLDIGTVPGWGNLETIVLAADTASAALMESTFEPQTVCTPAATESDATASTNASNTRPAVVPENNPAFIELQHKALAARRQTEIETARTVCGVFHKREALKGC